MTPPYPRIRPALWNGGLLLRESVNVCFYMPHAHRDVAPWVARALEIYLRAVGRDALAWYPDHEGDWCELDGAKLESLQREWLDAPAPGGQVVDLYERPDAARGYAFEYRGKEHDDIQRGAVCALSVWFPTEYLEAHGPERVRALALELAALLPFCSGQGGLAFNRVGRPMDFAELRLRYPGIDDLELMGVSWNLGTRVRGPAWLNFLGPPVLEQFGGLDPVRSRLKSPHTTVQSLSGGRAVITLGSWPEAGDTAHGNDLPHYRELARVLEPLMYQEHASRDVHAAEETRRWERRFLD